MSNSSAEEAFRHVLDSYRWLAASTANWTAVKKGGLSAEELGRLDGLLPNVDVALQAGVLSSARGLIEFYAGLGWQSDINSSEVFGIDLSGQADSVYLRDTVKPSIDGHLLHLAERRDASNPNHIDRLAWDDEIPDIVDRLVRLLEAVVELTPLPRCQPGFVRLLAATKDRLANRQAPWPTTIEPN